MLIRRRSVKSLQEHKYQQLLDRDLLRLIVRISHAFDKYTRH
jgi:hypothetical protein